MTAEASGIPASPLALGIRYAAFAVIATAVNLLTQRLSFAVYNGPYALYGALALGTLVGLVAKYTLDKRWIFADRSSGAATHARKFSLYTLMGGITTAVFWGTELAFDALLGGENWRYVGGAIGLTIGYIVKYRLDRRFVFDNTESSSQNPKADNSAFSSAATAASYDDQQQVHRMTRFAVLGRSGKLAFFCLTSIVFAISIYTKLGLEMADDAAFFLRYAENMVAGQFWVWNLGEAPVWGASAPFFPLLVAIPIALGVPSVPALIGTSLLLSTVSLSAIALMLALRFSVVAGLAFTVFACLDTTVLYYSGSGLETPLTFALLAFGIWAALYRPASWVVGLAAGLLMIQKLDLVPIGGLLLAIEWLRRGRLPVLATLVAAAIAAAWYGFAWVYFGAPVPNSFLTKSLHQESLQKIIDWRWFGGFVLLNSFHPWLVGLAAVGLLRQGRQFYPFFLFLIGTLAVHLAAYTLKYPFEPYNWYCMPSMLVLFALGAVGVHALGDMAARLAPRYAALSMAALPLAVVLAVGAYAYPREKAVWNGVKTFIEYQEHDRSEAGRWVDANTPKDAVVYTMWGNPAYYAQRQAIDGSFLNRRFETGDVIKKYKPEILIFQNNPGSTPFEPQFAYTTGEGYKIVKIFQKSYAVGMDYFFIVLARDDIVGKLTNVDLPQNLLRFVQNISYGDGFGIVKPLGSGMLFVHPGVNTPTSLDFDAAAYLQQSGRKTVRLSARMAPNVPPEAVARGGAVVDVTVFEGEKTLATAVVTPSQPFEREFAAESGNLLRIVVGNHGSPDTDWMHLSVE